MRRRARYRFVPPPPEAKDLVDRLTETAAALGVTEQKICKILSDNLEKNVHIGSVAVAGETLFLPVMDELRLVDLASGEPLETHSLDDHAQSVTLANGYCLVTTTEGLVAFQEESDR